MMAERVASSHPHAQTRAQRHARSVDGPADLGTPLPHRSGNAQRGKQVFRFETFGNERFWTDALRTPEGVVKASRIRLTCAVPRCVPSSTSAPACAATCPRRS